MKQSVFVLDKLRKRLKEYGLELNEEKTKIVHCNKPSRNQSTPPDIPVSLSVYELAAILAPKLRG